MSAALATIAALLLAAVVAVVVASEMRRQRPAYRRALAECRATTAAARIHMRRAHFEPWSNGDVHGDEHLC